MKTWEDIHGSVKYDWVYSSLTSTDRQVEAKERPFLFFLKQNQMWRKLSELSVVLRGEGSRWSGCLCGILTLQVHPWLPHGLWTALQSAIPTMRPWPTNPFPMAVLLSPQNWGLFLFLFVPRAPRHIPETYQAAEWMIECFRVLINIIFCRWKET